MMQENKRHLFGKFMLLGMFVLAGLCSVATKAMNEGDRLVFTREELGAFAAQVADAAVTAANKKSDKPQLSIGQIVRRNGTRALLILAPVVALTLATTPSVRALASQGATSFHIGLLKMWRALPWAQAKKESLAGEIEVLEAEYRKRGDNRPEFKVSDVFDNFKKSGNWIGYSAVFFATLMGGEITGLK